MSDAQVFHLTKKNGNKKVTIALAVLHERPCLANAETMFYDHGHDTNARGTSVEWATVCSQKMWTGYADECPIYNDKEKSQEPTQPALL